MSSWLSSLGCCAAKQSQGEDQSHSEKPRMVAIHQTATTASRSSLSSRKVSFPKRFTQSSLSLNRLAISSPTNFVHVQQAGPKAMAHDFRHLELGIHKSSDCLSPLRMSSSEAPVDLEKPSQTYGRSRSMVMSTVNRKPVPRTLTRIATMYDLDGQTETATPVLQQPEARRLHSSLKTLPAAYQLERVVSAFQESDDLDRQIKNIEKTIQERKSALDMRRFDIRDAIVKRKAEVLSPRPSSLSTAQVCRPQSSPMRPGYNRQHTFGASGSPAPLLKPEEEKMNLENLPVPERLKEAPNDMDDILEDDEAPEADADEGKSALPLPVMVLAADINQARPPLVQQNSSSRIRSWLSSSRGVDKPKEEASAESMDTREPTKNHIHTYITDPEGRLSSESYISSSPPQSFLDLDVSSSRTPSSEIGHDSPHTFTGNLLDVIWTPDLSPSPGSPYLSDLAMQRRNTFGDAMTRDEDVEKDVDKDVDVDEDVQLWDATNDFARRGSFGQRFVDVKAVRSSMVGIAF